jgi:hypothetical protein
MSCSIFRNANTNEIEKILAPNGKESILFNSVLNLPEIAGDKEKALKTWAMVYTKPFKQWFGDWEKGEGSKVVDSNGEPLLVYHGSAEKFDTFDVPTIANMFPSAVFFSSDISYAQYFAKAVKKDYEFLKEVYNDKLKSLTAVTDALDAEEGYPWLYDAIDKLSKQSYSAKEIVDLIYKNIDNPEFFREDFERMYIQDSGDEGAADFREEPETEEEKKDYEKYQLEQEKKITDKQNEVYSLIALSDRTLDIVNALENQVTTAETSIVKKAKIYNKKELEETLYPCFLNIKNPGYMFNMTSKTISNVREFSDQLEDKDGVIGKDEKTKDVKTTSKGLEFAVFDPNQIKSVFNQGTFSTQSDKIYYNLSPDTLDIEIKAANVLQSDAAIKLFKTLEKNKVTGDAFWNKIQNDLQIPKQQINLLKQYNTTDREELITNMLADYSYTVEINTAKETGKPTQFQTPEGDLNTIYYNLANDRTIYDALAKESKYKYKLSKESTTIVSDIKLAMRELGVEKNDELAPHEFESLNEQFKEQDMVLLSMNQEDSNNSKVENVVSTNLDTIPNDSKIEFIINRLQELVPGVNIKFISPNEIAGIINNPSIKTDRVNAFRRNNTVYLVQGRFNGEMAIEETLHPIVEAIMVEDPTLAADLLFEINELFPEITSDVNETYTNAKGFTNADRQNEIISRGLAGLLNLRLEDNFDKKYKKTKSVIKRAIEYISNLLSKIVSKGKYYLGMKPLSYKVDQVLSMLEEGTLQYAPKVGGKIFFNLSSDQEDMYSYLYSKANEQQREVLEGIIEKNIIHDEDDHTYVDSETGESLQSITSVLKGAADPRFLMRMEFGNDFDFIMNSICLGKNFDTIKTELKHMPEDVAKSFYDEFSIYTRGIRANGSIIVPQLVQADVKSKKAGKLDMLIIDPLGNLYIIDLKTTTSNYSVNSPKYDFKYVIGSQEEIDENIPMEERTTGVGSIFYGQKMSIRQQQGIQQHSYKKMIELKGFFVRGVKTLHYRTLIDDNKIVGFKFDDEVDHTASIYPEVDQIITTEVNYKVTKLKTLEGEQAKPENRQIVAEINDTVDAAVENLKSKKKYLEGLPGSKKNVLAPPEYIEKIQELITTMELTLSRGNPALAYSELVKFVNSDINDRLEKIRSGSLPASEMLTLLLESEKDFEEYENYVNTPKLRLQNKTLTRLADESLNNIRDFKNIVQEETREYMKTFVSENTSRDLSREDIEDIIKQAEDISRQDYLFGDMATSTDTILAVIDKKYKALLQEVYDKKDEIMRTMTKLGNDLALLTPKSERNEKDMYKFMLKENKDGKTTGYFVRPIGDKYWTMYDNIQKKLKDDEGETKKYIMITNPNTADEVDIKYNQELYKAKQERNEFSKKEKMDKDGNIVDGEYHKYNTEFKEARAKHQDIEYYKDADGNIVGYSWIRKAGVSDKAYNKFLAKYYTDAVTYLKPVMEKSKTGDRVFRGRVVEESSSFVKSEFVEIREISETGVDMRDEKYIKLMNPVTELDKARSEFYKAWVKNYEEQLDNLSPDVAKKMLNRIPVIQSNFEREIKSKGDGFMKSVLKGMRNLNIFDLKAAPQTAVLDENGNVKPGIPVFYTGDTQNEWKLTNLKAKKAALKAEWKDEKMTTKEYREKVKGIDTAIKIEEGKIKKSQVSNDMVLNIIEFTKMAENFKVMSEFEATVDTALRVLKKERKYTKRDAGGNLIKNAANKSIAKFAGEGALTVSRLEKWMDMVLYRTVDPYNSKLGRFTKKLQSMMSLRSVGLNPFGQMNNYLMGRINNHIESYGGNLFAKRAYYRSVLEYQKDFVPGWFRKKASVLKAKADGSSGYYEIAKPTSKYEAMASYFRMMRKLQSIDGLGTMQDRVFDMAYMMQESAEYNIQTKTGNAVIMTETLTNTKTGEVVSIYDAFDFNSNTGEIKLKDGFEFTSEQKHQITNKIYEVNKQIHGNYAYEDRMVIQESLMGELVAQFHKWIYPMFKQKFQKGYIDENLGEMEGRYYTLWSLTKQVVLLRDAKESWSELSDVQKGNIYKSAAEMSVMLMSYILYSILASLGDDLDDDDELLGFRQKKLLNILTAQSDRLSSEVSTGFNPKEWYRMAKNPAALFGYLGDLMEAVGATGTFITSMGDPEVTRYKKGVHKGDLKMWKEWKDLIPGLYVSNRYDSYETVKTFFIK